MTTIDRLHELDAHLRHIAHQRKTAAEADDVGLAENLDEDWRAADQQRQDLRAAAMDESSTRSKRNCGFDATSTGLPAP